MSDYNINNSNDDIQFEHIVSAAPVKRFDEMKNGSVVFVFGCDMRPIACDIDYLYAESEQNPTYEVKNADFGIIDNMPTVVPNGNYIIDFDDEQNTYFTEATNRKRIYYKFLDVVKNLAFKYGLKKEYYKNKYGKWIDVSLIRPYFNLANPSGNIYESVYTGQINDNIKQESLYVKVCDSVHFEFSGANSLSSLSEVADLNDIPAVDYIVKENDVYGRNEITGESIVTYNNSGLLYHIGKGDGSFEYNRTKHHVFVPIEEETVESIDPEAIRFRYQLVNKNSAINAAGTYIDNNHHMTDDLLLSFFNPDGSPFTELTNLFINLNGLVVDYEAGPNPNQIYLIDVVKYAAYQKLTIKNGYNIDNFVKYTTTENGVKVLDLDLPEDAVGLNYHFDIQVHKWDDTKISHFINPNSVAKLLKTKKEEPTKSFLLDVKLSFGTPVDKDKCILICGNTIVDKDSWKVTKEGDIYLTTVSSEFDILYAEMYRRMRVYLASMLDHTIENAPKLSDYLKEHYSSVEDIDKAYQEYLTALEEWSEISGGDKFHYTKSAFDIVTNQFKNRQYAIIKFDNIEPHDYTIQVLENKHDLYLNKPMRNKFYNENWTPDDLIIMNGMVHRFVNDYENVFSSPMTWYRTDINGIYDDVNAYKLEVVKHYNENDRFKRLSYGQLMNGVKNNVQYYYKTSENTYARYDTLSHFEFVYKELTDAEILLGFDTSMVYYINEGNTYTPVPSSQRFFEPGIKYYKKVFSNKYYILK